MPESDKKISPPKPSTKSGNGQGKKMPSGPSPHVRENFIKKIKEIIKKKSGG